MAVERIYDDNVNEFLNEGNRVLVVGADFCGDCLPYGMLVGFVDKWAREQGADIRFGKVEVGRGAELPVKIFKGDDWYHLREGKFDKVIPYTYLFEDGNLVHDFGNIQSHGFLRRAIEEHLGVKIDSRRLEPDRDYVKAAMVSVF